MDQEEPVRAKRTSKLTKKQAVVMVNYMNDHKDFACGKVEDLNGRLMMLKRWKELAELLNNEGPPKTEGQWKKAWKDLKVKARFKNSRLIAEHSSSMKMQGIAAELSKVDQMVLSIVGPRNANSFIETDMPIENIFTISQGSEEDEDQILMLTDTLSDIEINNKVLIGHSPFLEESQPSMPKAPSQPENGVNETLKCMQSQLNSYDERYSGVMKAISEAFTSLTQSHSKLLKLETESHTGSIKLERLKLENQRKFEAMLKDMVDYHRRIAMAQERKNERIVVAPQNETRAGDESGIPRPTDNDSVAGKIDGADGNEDRGSSTLLPEDHRPKTITNRKRAESEGDNLHCTNRSIGEPIANGKYKTEHTIFGEYVVSEIQKLTDPYILAVTKNNIQQVLFEASLKQIAIDQSSSSTKSNHQIHHNQPSVQSSITSVPSSPVVPVTNSPPSTETLKPENPRDAIDRGSSTSPVNAPKELDDSSANVSEDKELPSLTQETDNL